MKPRSTWRLADRLLRRAAAFLRYRVLHADDTPHRIALGVAIGFFVAWMPLIGFQMLVALALCAALRANKLASLPFVWISNPLTILPVYYPAYALGVSLLYGSHSKTWNDWRQMVSHVFGQDLGWWQRTHAFWSFAWDVAVPLWLGSLLLGTVMAVAAYPITYAMVTRYRAGRARRLINKATNMLDLPQDRPAFILASQSPRRQQLLRQAGYRFAVVPPPLEEPNEEHSSLSPAQQAESLAYFKARCVADQVGDALPILAADTIVTDGYEVFGKPADADDARRILRRLAGTRHQVITGVALLTLGRRRIASQVTTVKMRTMRGDQLERYIAGRAWEGKAGAYGIQDQNDEFVEAYEGSFTNVVGLPMELVRTMLDAALQSGQKE